MRICTKKRREDKRTENIERDRPGVESVVLALKVELKECTIVGVEPSTLKSDSSRMVLAHAPKLTP